MHATLLTSALLTGLAFGTCLFAWRRRTALRGEKQQQLIRLLMVGGKAFKDPNPELYAAATREIVELVRDEAWSHNEIESRTRHALSVLKKTSAPEDFAKVSSLAENMLLAVAISDDAVHPRALVRPSIRALFAPRRLAPPAELPVRVRR